MKKVNVKGKIDHIMPPRMIKDGAEKVVDIRVSDSTGKINLALFNGQSENLKVGDEVSIESGYTREYDGVLTLYVIYGTLNGKKGGQPS
jgi:ssDNA-binding replication factor A large subunit